MRQRFTVIAALALALAAPPARALAAPADVAATHAYIQANYTLAQAGVARIGPAQSKIERFIARLEHECPGAGSGSPQDEQTGRFTYDVGVALWSIAYGTSAGPIRTFIGSVKRLRWSNQAINRAAQSYAGSLQALATLPLPNLCADVRSWRASGYRTVPAPILALDQRVEAIELVPVPQRLLAPYERGSDAGVFGRTIGLEKRLEERESNPGEGDLLKVLDVLGLQE
jgi:hypothetical protein